MGVYVCVCVCVCVCGGGWVHICAYNIYVYIYIHIYYIIKLYYILTGCVVLNQLHFLIVSTSVIKTEMFSR